MGPAGGSSGLKPNKNLATKRKNRPGLAGELHPISLHYKMFDVYFFFRIWSKLIEHDYKQAKVSLAIMGNDDTVSGNEQTSTSFQIFDATDEHLFLGSTRPSPNSSEWGEKVKAMSVSKRWRSLSRKLQLKALLGVNRPSIELGKGDETNWKHKTAQSHNLRTLISHKLKIEEQKKKKSQFSKMG